MTANEKILILSERQKILQEVLKMVKTFKSYESEFLEDWINAKLALTAEGLDVCPNCKSLPHKVAGGCRCPRCGMTGVQPWGG